MSRPVLVAGEALVDVVIGPDGETLDVAPGGAPLNVAVGLSRLDVPTHLLTTVADDEHGARVSEHLEESRVLLHPGSRASGRTSVARARLDEHRHASYEFDLSWDPPEPSLPDRCRAVHVGSLGTVLEPGAARITDLAARARAAGLVLSYDPNVRPTVLGDVSGAWEQVRRIAAVATLVKLSDEDAHHLQPGRALDHVVDHLLRGESTRLVVVTRGADGLVLATRRDRVEVPAPTVDVVDTVGAGDACMAGLLAALHERDQLDVSSVRRLGAGDLVAIGTMAAAVAARTCTRRGANPPWRRELADDGGSTGW